MDIWGKLKTALGYETGNGGVDSFGVDHSGFSLRDELEYQMARSKREQELIQNYNKQGITENYPQYGTNFWGGSPENNYGFGTSNISQNIQNVTNQLNNSGFGNGANNGQAFANSDYTVNKESLVGKPSSYFQNTNQQQLNNNLQSNNTGFNSSNSTDIPRYWETAADGKKVYDYMLQKEGNFTPQIQRSELYQYSALSAVPNMVQNYNKLAPQKVTDKYKHAYMNCSAAQYGQGGADVAMLASNLREWYDKKVGKNTLDSSEGDQYANRIGRFLGSKYPEEDCDELVQRYINRRY